MTSRRKDISVRIIGAGFGRTGTSTQHAALTALGFEPCYHMEEAMYNYPEHADAWASAYSGRLPQWRDLFGGIQATVDFPGCFFWRELMEEYPDAKVILSVRD